MHNDQPTLSDFLDRHALVEEVGTAIATCEPPQVLGVHGDWGLGKTSFLHQVQWFLTGQCPQQPEAVMQPHSQEKRRYANSVRTVWFDAWRYQNEDVPVVALLHELRSQLSWNDQLAHTRDRARRIIVQGALLSIEELTKKIGLQYSKFRQVDQEWKTETFATKLPSFTLRELLRTAIDKLLPDPSNGDLSPRLAIFIDDLDRCDPESAYRLLEGLKIYLTLENCVFIIGMNQKAIEEAISSRLESVPEPLRQQRAAAYLEKLCQNVWRLPTVLKPSDVLHRFLQDLLKSARVSDLIKAAVEIDGQQCLPPNPRRLKGLANLVERMSAQLNFDEDVDRDDAVQEARILIVVAYVYQFHQDLYVRWEADPSLYVEIVRWCDGEQNPNLEFFDLMVLPKQVPSGSRDARQPTPGSEVGPQNTYPNPTEASVFWIQPLVRELGGIVGSDRFVSHLHIVRT